MKNNYCNHPKAILLLLLMWWVVPGQAQNNKKSTKDQQLIRKMYDLSLTQPKAYEWLDFLCNKIGGRLAGSPQAAAAVEFTRQVMDTLGVDRVFLQDVMVPHWVRGDKEIGKIVNSQKIGSQEVRVCALGNSVGTGGQGIAAEVVEVKNFDELRKLGKGLVQGKIVFFNRPFDNTKIATFRAYGGAVNQRGSGASEAAKLGAIGMVVRSMTGRIDDYPHTGSLRYQLNVPKIPAVAISTKGAELLSSLLKDDRKLKFYFRTTCKMLKEKKSYNVVGELKGTQYPDEIIVVGGHLDSWDTGDGAHDDGAGVVQSMDVLRLIKAAGIKPKRTIRAVMFMNEENGLRGGRKYAELAAQNKEKHIAALESDAGGFSPRAIGINNDFKKFAKVQKWAKLFAPYGVQLRQGGGGADIGPLRTQGVTIMGLSPDGQRYFDYHHTETDTFDKVNPRELQLGAAAMATMVYLLAEYGL
ncbi:M20/M25/M40 family metallo-hydrolase [Microscilla marina]|uniref:Carboxypeptidase Q n=1 Tax=Microscilla marina ATCC 23134 TaxID=313606 RepID=A1ZZ61_MICM2|nr:M20/M25/M40 family metallo-hydrolase [Microscilla marina]EAY24320.1 peptidase, M28D family [Microscilla marina ATCC 23134]